MKRIICSFIFMAFVAFAVNAQQKTTYTTTESAEPSKVFFGGNVGFFVGSEYWTLNLAPLVGYRFTPSVIGGVSALFEYNNYHGYVPSYSVNSYGGGVFARYDLGATLMKSMPFSIFFQTDYEGRQQEISFKDSRYKNYSEWQNRLYLGAGYSQPIGARSRAFFMISIDVLHLNGAEAVQPVIRAGIEI